MDSIEKGIVELISQHGVRKLVMGAATDRPHSRCQFMYQSVLVLEFPSPTPRSRMDAEGNYDEWDRLSRRSHSPGSAYSTYLALVPFASSDRSESGSDLSALPHLKEDLLHSSPPSVLDGSIDDTLYNHLEQALAEAENAKREAFNEAVRRGKAEKDAINAIRRAEASESLYAEESRQRKEIVGALAKERAELESMKNLRDEVMDELRAAQNKKLLLETQLEESNEVVKELEKKNFSAVELLQNYKEERDELQMERDSALREAEELRRKQGEATSTHIPRFFSEFSFLEIEEAARNFDPSLKIGEGASMKQL